MDGDAVGLRQLLRMFQQDALEIVLVGRLHQTVAEIHVGQQRRERPPRLQRVLGRFLNSKKFQKIP